MKEKAGRCAKENILIDGVLLSGGGGVLPEAVYKAATGFSDGCCGTGNFCGAVSGGRHESDVDPAGRGLCVRRMKR